MMFCEIIHILIFISIGTVTAMPEHLICCSPEMGIFEYTKSRQAICRQESSGKTNHLQLTCPLFNVFLREDLSLNITGSGQVFHTNRILLNPVEFKRGEICFANKTYLDSDETTEVVVLCKEVEEDYTVLSYCMSISAVFLILTAVIYAALPEVRDLQGKSIINFCGSMGIGLGILSGNNLTAYSDMTLCAIRGFMIYFFLLVGFFWTNAISIQVLLSLRRPVVRNYGWKEFCWYALYAWGCPTVLTLCMAIVNFHPGDHRKPGIGLNTCWFYSTTHQWYYMYSVMLILIVANICIYIFASIQLWRPSFSSNHIKALKYNFIISLRMLAIMGITWIFELISTLTEKTVVWFIIDVFNALQGPLIFLLLVVFRKRVVRALLNRGYLPCIAEYVERHLAVRDDEEEGIMEHNVDLTTNQGTKVEI